MKAKQYLKQHLTRNAFKDAMNIYNHDLIALELLHTRYLLDHPNTKFTIDFDGNIEGTYLNIPLSKILWEFEINREFSQLSEADINYLDNFKLLIADAHQITKIENIDGIEYNSKDLEINYNMKPFYIENNKIIFINNDNCEYDPYDYAKNYCITYRSQINIYKPQTLLIVNNTDTIFDGFIPIEKLIKIQAFI